jgi:malate dehydrogenase (oxaloacetate-decarboxylating)
MLLAAAKALSRIVPESALSEEYILPSVFDKQIVPKVAKAVAQAAIDSGMARRTNKETEEEM